MMLAPWLLAPVALAYLGLLFAIAWWGDRTAGLGRSTVPRPVVYSLSLAVYCTSWAFYGTVGQSATLGWALPPTYIGTILLFLFAPALLRKLVAVSRRERITSVADFIAARYGRDRTLAVVVTLIATCGIIPYIALQLKAIDISFKALAATPAAGPLATETTAYVAATLALFAILFGARQVDATEHHPGMMLALAFESVVKLLAFVAVGMFVTFGLFDGFGDLATRVADSAGVGAAGVTQSATGHYIALVVLGFLAIFCLPRQFHVAVVENGGPQDLRLARWVFPVYLLAIGAFVLPIARAGLIHGAGEADLFVLTLPLQAGAEGLALLAFIGGLSAATGMVIVASVALATMLCNEVTMPVAMRLLPALRLRRDLTGWLLAVRRIAIVLLLLLAWLYHRWVAQSDALASIGETAMAAVALFGPAIIAGLYWRTASRAGAIASLGLGFAIWGWTLVVPTLVQAGLLPVAVVQDGPAGIGWLRPTALFGVAGLNGLAHGLLWSLGAAVAALITGSLASGRSLVERVQAAAFVDADTGATARAFERQRERLTVRELKALTERFVGARRATSHFAELGTGTAEDSRASGAQLEATQRLLASVVGASSAQRLLRAAVAGREVPIEDVVSLVDSASQAIEFSQELLQAALENLDQGVSVIDADRRLVAWNRRYIELYRYPPGLVRVGRPVEELLRWNARRGELGPGDPDDLVHRRLEHLARGTAYSVQRERPDSTVLEIRGNPMPGGGFVTSYTDVTEYKQAEKALTEANESLERRVLQRTRDLSAINEELLSAKAAAERANSGKTRFLAAAGHDLLQPLNAAGLFAGALAQKALTRDQTALLQDIETCLSSAEVLLSDLLDISKLDAGVIRAELADLDLAGLIDDVASHFRLQADARGLEFRVRRTRLAVRSDRTLLKRVLQNFVSNALRYTTSGGVLVGVRGRRGVVRIEVWDTGVGIRPEQQSRVFEEFYRGAAPRGAGEVPGSGLGLAIAERIAQVLGHRIGMRSVAGRGSVFWVECQPGAVPARPPAPPAVSGMGADLERVRVLAIDNDPAALRALEALLNAWGCTVAAHDSMESYLAARPSRHGPPDVLVVDYHLDGGATGVDVVRHLRTMDRVDSQAIIVSADGDARVREEAEAVDGIFLRKPLKPLQLRSALRRIIDTAARHPDRLEN